MSMAERVEEEEPSKKSILLWNVEY